MPLADFATATAALAVVAIAGGEPRLPAFPVAPLLAVAAAAALRGYALVPARRDPRRGGGQAVTWVLAATLFAWSASLLGVTGSLAQLALFTAYLLFGVIARRALRPLLRRLDQPERWLLVGDEDTAEALRRHLPTHDRATLVGTVPISSGGSADHGRIDALEAVEHHRADRVLIADRDVDEESLLSLMRAFKSVGVPVSLLPRPLDLLAAPLATPIELAGVPLIDVGVLATHPLVPYLGPDRRHDRRVRISVVVPAKNEERNVGYVLQRLPDGIHEVILVDAGSSDETVAVARRARPDIRVLTQSGRGKGDALRTGFAAVTGNVIVMLDADGSADPAEIPRFVAALERGADFAKGSRFLPGGGSDDITLLRRCGNAFLSGTANLLHGTEFTDLCYGYNAFWARCLPFVSLDVPGFEVETLINLRVADAGMTIIEVPSYEASRRYGQSNLNTFRDGFRVLGTILREGEHGRKARADRPPLPARPPGESEGVAT